MNLLLIRHALPNRIEMAEGRADPDISPEGVRQAHALGIWLAPEHLDAIYASHLVRAQQTAEAIIDGRDIKIVTEPDVAEFDRDSSSYIPFEEIDRNSAEFRAIVTGDYSAIGGPDPAEFTKKIVAAMDRIIDAHAGQTVAVVCHAGVINAYFAHILGLDRTIFFGPDYTSVSRVKANSEGLRGVGSLNETAHLRNL